MARNLSLDDGLEIATRHPQTCVNLLANNLYPLLEEQLWFDREWRARFCAYFLQNLVDASIEAEVDPALMERMKRLPLTRCFPLINSSPCAGLKLLVAIISQHLRQAQGLSVAEQYEFYNTMFGRFFPEAEHPAGHKQSVAR